MSLSHRATRALALLLPLALLFLAACAAKLTPQMSHQGRLLDAGGQPVADGNYDVVYSIYQVATGGTAVYSETQTVAVENGLFTTSIGLSGAITPTLFAQPTWLEVKVEGETLTPRQRLQGSPYAFSMASGSVVQGTETIDRTFFAQEDTGAALTVLNTDATATGGHGLLVMNQAAADIAGREKVAALQARAIGGSAASNTGSYGAIITSNAYRGMYAKGATDYYAAVFDSNVGIYLVGGGGCTGCTLLYTAENVGDAPIEAGDFVSIVNVKMDPDLNMPVMQVRKAAATDPAAIGVATSALTRRPVSVVQGVTTGGFEATDGAAAAGSHVLVAVQGLVQARTGGVSAQAGGRLGSARVMSEADADGLVWVMLSGQ
jgi:hypothetical protein